MRSESKQKCYLVGNEELLKDVCHVRFHIVLLKLGYRQVLDIRIDNRLQNVRDLALAVRCTSNTY